MSLGAQILEEHEKRDHKRCPELFRARYTYDLSTGSPIVCEEASL